MAEGLKRSHASVYGPAQRVRVFRGPGRVNVIGEHTDYNLGFVLPMALDLACFVAAAPNSQDVLRVFSEDRKEKREWPVAALADLKPARDWGDYVAGVAQQLVKAGLSVGGMDLLIHSTVPVGAGLSSSAALETSTALALLDGRSIDPLELAKLCRRAENLFVGMPCGIMDQYVSVFGREHAVIRIDCRSLQHEAAELPSQLEMLAVNTMVKHELGQSAYRDRVRECGEAVEAIRAAHPDIESLRDVSEALFQVEEARIAPVPRKRARHVVTEDARVEAFLEAARQGDATRMGQLMTASHRSLQHDYEVSCEELDFLVDTALAISGVLGARMTGGGFGGCTVNLMQPGSSVQFQERIAAAYEARFGLTPRFYPCRPSAGAGEV